MLPPARADRQERKYQIEKTGGSSADLMRIVAHCCWADDVDRCRSLSQPVATGFRTTNGSIPSALELGKAFHVSIFPELCSCGKAAVARGVDGEILVRPPRRFSWEAEEGSGKGCESQLQMPTGSKASPTLFRVVCVVHSTVNRSCSYYYLPRLGPPTLPIR